MRGRLRSGDDPIAARNARTTSRNELAAARNEIERLKKGMLQLVEQLRVSNEELWHARATVENFRQREDERDVNAQRRVARSRSGRVDALETTTNEREKGERKRKV